MVEIFANEQGPFLVVVPGARENFDHVSMLLLFLLLWVVGVGQTILMICNTTEKLRKIVLFVEKRNPGPRK
ncbi:G-protein coupled receptor [Trichinella spiralis]|uniref:G-protein coupled receptor n=1 Tax=Trichinella spiralis TaxID=6334 RepID=A0ABR3KYR5_TRISP